MHHVFIGFFSPSSFVLFSCHLMTVSSDVFGFLFLFCVHICYRFLVFFPKTLFLTVVCCLCRVLSCSGCCEQGLLLSCSAQASHCGGLSCCGAWAPVFGLSSYGAWAQLPQYVESCWTQDGTCVPCIGRQIPNHWDTREVLLYIFGLRVP